MLYKFLFKGLPYLLHTVLSKNGLPLNRQVQKCKFPFYFLWFLYYSCLKDLFIWNVMKNIVDNEITYNILIRTCFPLIN